jgi:NADPH-dependent dioxygenase
MLSGAERILFWMSGVDDTPANRAGQMTMKSHLIDVLVAGAGPVGLSAALQLNNLGLRVAVVDAKSRGVTHSYALALHPASLELLDALGALEPVLAQARKVSSVAVYCAGRRVAAAPVARAGSRFPFVAVIGQDGIEGALAGTLAARGVSVRWNTRLARFQQDPDMVSVDLDELEERVIGYAAARFDWMVRQTQTLDVRFLLGADGHHSLVRRQLLIDFPEVRPAEHFAVFEFESAADLGSEVSIVLHDDGFGVLWPLPDGRGRWSFSVDPTRHPEAWREKDHEPVQIIGPGMYPALEEAFFKRLLSARAPWFNSPINHVYWRMLVRFERRQAASFGEGRVWLAGDAGHLTGPAGIQSMNVGLREARDLAAAIAGAVAEGRITEGLETYQRERGDEWRRLHGIAGSVEAFEDAAPEVARFKDQILACLPASGPELARMAAGLGLRVKG